MSTVANVRLLITSNESLVTSATNAYFGEKSMPFASPMLGIVASTVLFLVSMTTTLLSGDCESHQRLLAEGFPFPHQSARGISQPVQERLRRGERHKLK